MKFLPSIRIATKLPVIIVALCLAVSTAIAVLGYFDFRKTVVAQTQETYQIVTEERRAALQAWFDRVGEDVLSLGADPTVAEAITGLNNVYGIMMDDPTAYLQRVYIDENPSPIGQKDAFDQAPDAVPYNFRHAEVHPYFRNIKDARGFYDVFLFNMDGDLIYSVYKETDFATNFNDGPYRSTGLGRAMRRAYDAAQGDIIFEDYAPYAPSGDAHASFLAAPVFTEAGQMVGVVAVQLPPEPIANIINNPTGLGDTGELYVIGADLTSRNASRFAGRHGFFDPMPLLPQVMAARDAQPMFHADIPGIQGERVVSKSLSLDVFDTRWGLVGEIDLSEVMEPVVDIRNRMIIISLIGAVIAGVLGCLTARSVLAPLKRLGQGMQAIAAGQYDTNIADTDRQDEIGDLAGILLAFRDQLGSARKAREESHAQQQEQTRVVERLSAALKALADGNLTTTINTPFSPQYDTLRLDYNRSIETLNKTVGSVVACAHGIRQRAEEMSRSSDELSQRTENQAATLEQTAAALDGLTASVKSAASGAREVETIVSEARSDADESAPVVRNAVAAMTEIEKSSIEISQIIAVIDDIAFQTNLLALNAGVEAARAGDAGRGFAVVASEVRALAQRSSDAAKQIKDLIGGSAQQVEKGVCLVDKAGAVLTRIVERIAHISTLMGEIASGAEEQSIGLGEINIGVTQLDKVTQQNSAMVDEATAGNHALTRDARALADIVVKFQLMATTDSAVPSPVTTSRGTVGENVMVFNSPRAKNARVGVRAIAKEPQTALRRTGTAVSAVQQDDRLWEDF
ncbi:methyl-accepting chemotaxis protein [Yoonia sp.]|uniref:methyl-accepting chemotaxis protein n=1 Tax=Yoonia sp. TaxID=2212373 RepID=UPI003F6BC468